MTTRTLPILLARAAPAHGGDAGQQLPLGAPAGVLPARVRLRREPTTAEEARIAALLAQGPEPVDRLAARLADLAYRRALAAGAAAVDVGIWGPALFAGEARARLAMLLGDLLEAADEAGRSQHLGAPVG